jgi:transposase
MIQTLFLNNDAVLQDDDAPIHTAGTVQSWFEEHEGELQHLPCPAQSPELKVIEQLWLVLETGGRNRFPSLSSLKQLQYFLQIDWYKIPLETSKLVRVYSKKYCCCSE